MYVAVKGGERAIEKRPIVCWRMSAAAIATSRNLSLAQISEQLGLGVDRVHDGWLAV